MARAGKREGESGEGDEVEEGEEGGEEGVEDKKGEWTEDPRTATARFKRVQAEAQRIARLQIEREALEEADGGGGGGMARNRGRGRHGVEQASSDAATAVTTVAAMELKDEAMHGLETMPRDVFVSLLFDAFWYRYM